MDVTFRESEPYYGEKTDLSSLFELDDLSINQDDREGENHDVISSPIEQNQRRMEAVITGSTPQPRMETMTSDLDPTPCQEDSSVGEDPRYKGPLRVYKRRMRTSREEVPGITPESATPQEIVDVSSTSSTEIEESGLDDLLRLVCLHQGMDLSMISVTMSLMHHCPLHIEHLLRHYSL